MLLRLFVGEKQLLLPPDVRVRMQLFNPLLYTAQQGGLTFPFTAPVCPVNADALGLSHLPNVPARRRSENARLEVGPFHLTGILTLLDTTHRDYSLSLTVPPGLIPTEVWEKSIREFDFGKLDLSPIRLSTLLFRVDVPSTFITSPNAPINLVVQKNGGYVYNKQYEQAPDLRTTKEILARFAGDYTTNVTDGSSMQAFDEQLVLTSPQVHSFSLIVAYAGNATTPLFPGDPFLYYPNGTFNFTQVEYFSAEFNQEFTPNPFRSDPRFVLPVIKNLGHYSDENKEWNGFINAFDGGRYLFNNTTNRTRYSMVPCLRIPWILQKLCELLGFQLDVASLPYYFPQLLLYTNQSLDEQVLGLKMPFNQFKKSIVFAEHLPDMSLADFLDHLGRAFFGRLVFDPTNRRAQWVSLPDNVLRLPPRYDQTDRLATEYEKRLDDLTTPVLAFARDSSDSLATEAEAILDTYPAKATLAASAQKTTRHETNFSPMVQEELSLADVLNDNVPVYANGSLVISSDKTRQTPKLSQLSVSPLFGQEKAARSQPRLLIEVPGREVYHTDAARRPETLRKVFVPTADNTTPYLSLTWNGEKGLVDVLGKEWLAMESEPTYLRYSLRLNLLDLLTFDWLARHHLRGQNYLPAQIEAEFGPSGLVAMPRVTWRRA